MLKARVFLALAASLIATGCATTATQAALERGDVKAAIAAYEADPARELEDVRRIAERVLLDEARALDTARSARAWALLGGMGRGAQGAWSELERKPGDHHPQLVRTHALAFRSRLGDAPARRELRELEENARSGSRSASVEADLLAIALEALDPGRDVEALRGWARSTSAVVRGAALAQLARAPRETETRVLLAELARIEPDEAVREAAIRALGAQDQGAVATLEAIAQDANGASDRVRAAALASLLELDATRATPLVAGVLSAEPSMLGVAVAQEVLQRAARGAPSPALEPTAEQQLLMALAAPKPDLRGRAASALVAVASLQRAALRAELLVRLEAERDRRVHVLLALALRPDPSAERALATLMRGHDMPAAQAAAELARTHADAIARLRELAGEKEPAIRATAAAALARAYDFASRTAPPLSVRALLDADARVRASTAAALLQAIERLQAPR